MFTRIFDILIAVVGLINLGLILPWVALLIKMDSRGPVFYRCDRVGKGGRLFGMYKFRTMHESKLSLGHEVSPQGDPRVTDMGRFLRRTKLNELPQFYNLLKGDMTLIGPRPEAPFLAAEYPPEARAIFAVTPGLIGPNQIVGRNEEEWFPRGVDPHRYYLEEILPQKVARDLEYLENKTFLGDLKLLTLGVWATVTGAISRRHLADNQSQILLVGIDIVCCLLSLTLATLIRFEGLPQHSARQAFFQLLPLAVIFRLPVFYYFGFYQTLVRYFSLADVRKIFNGVLIGGVVLFFISFLGGIDIRSYGRSIFLIDWLLLTLFLIGYRVLAKAIRTQYFEKKPPNAIPERRAIIWGANDEGIWCHRFLKGELEPTYTVVGFIDPDPQKRHRCIDGLKVLGDYHHLEVLAKLYRIQEVFITNGDPTLAMTEPLKIICDQLSLGMKLFVPRSVEAIASGVNLDAVSSAYS
jgi:lipopolysaccharide/colanic/teichoic acid biosynthesis glycosyltransferase